MRRIFLLAILIRIICLCLFRNVTNYDLQSYVLVGKLTLKGLNIYPEIANLHHPYLPFFMYIEAISTYIGQIGLIGPISSICLIKAILVFFDLGILYLVYCLSKNNLKIASIYAINPVTILITTLHGQFDVIPVFFILLAVYLIKKKKDLLSVLCFSFAILVKTWPVLFFIPILRNIKNKILFFLIVFFPMLFITLYCIFFKSNPIDISKTLISYQGLWGIWGPFTLLGKTRIFWQKLLTILFLTSFLSYSWINKEKNLIKNILKLLFFFFIFTTNFSIQYFVWIIPFLILIKPKSYLILITLISIYLCSFYYFLVFCQTCAETPNWLLTIQNIVGFALWFSFIKIGYISSKKS